MSVRLERFTVTQPPTSDDVAERARTALDKNQQALRGILELSVKPVLENGTESTTAEKQLTLRIIRSTYDNEGNFTTIEGHLEKKEGALNIVTVILAEDVAAAAMVNVVSRVDDQD